MTSSSSQIPTLYTPPAERSVVYPLRLLFRNFLGCWPLVGLMMLGAVASTLTVPVSPNGFGARVAYTCFRIWARSLLRGFGVRVWVKGLEHLQQGAPGILVANHRSHLDIPVLGTVVKRPSVAVHKRSLEYIPLLGQVIWLSGSVGLNRGDHQGTRRRMEVVKKRLLGGRNVMIFPEGQRSRGKDLSGFKKGAAVLAIEQQCALTPITILGTDVLYPPGNLMIHQGDVLVVVHPPVPSTGMQMSDREALTETVRTIIASQFAQGPLDMSRLEGAVRVV